MKKTNKLPLKKALTLADMSTRATQQPFSGDQTSVTTSSITSTHVFHR